MQKDANIYDIARLAGVSKSTVSRVLNGHKGVSEDTRKRVQQAINDCTYIPNNSARSLSSISTRTVVLLVHGITNPFFSRIISLILEKMHDLNYDVILQSCELGSGQSMADAAISICKEKRPKGIFLLGGYFEENYPTLQMLNVPIVMVSTTVFYAPDRSWFSSVTINDEHEGEKMADYICRNGHRDIAVIGEYYQREKGMRKIFGQYGLHPRSGEVEYDQAYLFQTGYKTAKKFLEQGQYTCFLCLSDVLAIGAMKAVHERGLRVPEDISVVGFDGIESGGYTNPTLTTFVQPFDEMAEKSVETLLGIIDEGKPHEHIVLQATLNECGSFRSI
ncbi:MAG: LacI family transcriptional regulator [Defluviitaleaceae bacterium]|nr:LacI family transcriptional regulator [Defluviitaleaceae bacterium]MCL2238478.1 LacI family transcriptional regulator [Defluviitaleaceae bacterium]